MKLCICHASIDRVLAGKIGSLCDEMEIEHILDERSDWLMHGLRPRADEVTHLLVIVSPANEKSWWVPFRLGRAREGGIPVLLYPTFPVGGTRSFFGGTTTGPRTRNPEKPASRTIRVVSLGAVHPSGSF